MKEEGRIIKVENGAATIEIEPRSVCTKCCSCASSRKRYITAEAKDLKAGDVVEVNIDTSSMMQVYLLLYGAPLASFTLGAILIQKLWQSPIISFSGAVLFTAATYLLVGRYIRKSERFSPEICRRGASSSKRGENLDKNA